MSSRLDALRAEAETELLAAVGLTPGEVQARKESVHHGHHESWKLTAYGTKPPTMFLRCGCGLVLPGPVGNGVDNL